MKKIYTSPEVNIVKFTSEITLSAISAEGLGIDYGGIDTEGLLEPSSKDEFVIGDDSEIDVNELW